MCRNFSQYFNEEEYKLLGFLDSNPEKLGQLILGKPVLPLEKIKGIEDILIVITIASKKAKEEVKERLEREGLADKVFSFHGPANGFYSNEKNVQILLALLKAHGIRKIIASPGTTNMCFVASMQRDSFFHIISAPDERSAAYMACGLAKESGEPVVLSCTGATASRNYLPGLTEAYYSKLPVLAVTSCQHLGRVGQLSPQVIDRSAPPADTVKYSAILDCVHSEEDAWDCETKINTALLELKRNGGGPVHLNLATTYSRYFTQKNLPAVQCMERYTLGIGETLPDLTPGRVGIFVGAHKKWSASLTEAVDLFCEKYDAVVFCDHTSNYWGKYRVLPALVCHQEGCSSSARKMDVMLHIGEVSGSYTTMKPKEIWRISPDGEIRDAFKKLRYVFEMEEQSFFTTYLKKETLKTTKNTYYEEWIKEQEDMLKHIPELPFSNLWVAQQTSGKLPQNSILHLGILNTLRSWNFFEVTKGLHSHANTGGFGIDGCVSTAIGASLACPEKLVFCFVGDLAFFYDMNVLGNRHIGRNLRLLLINNGCGTEFHNYNHPAAVLNLNEQPYLAADGHYGNKSSDLVRHYAQDLGFEYMSAGNKEEYLSCLERFVSAELLEKPLIFEVFTDEETESEALYRMKHLIKK
ncbi:MAG: 2-succinyl-5-enolpyruvyl-6-hydroxy-3-cyclohexene-1-carboxylate synthase [Lachnospiraceae bacterium]|nr:2-succinyl-5-enolpyruvyl-6-hydroxy-3-cyclohexene-1-carboxylate synthase [Lachnospiraceae bacterium]